VRRARAGERLRISASDWNTLADLAEREGRLRGATGASEMVSAINRQSQILVRNNGEDPVGRFGVLSCGAPIIGPDVNLNEFVNRPALEGHAPLGRAGPRPVLVAQAPIRPGRIGLCAISGVTVAAVRVVDERHRYADTADGDLTLVSTWSGPVRIISIGDSAPEDGPDIRAALVAFGRGPDHFEAVVSDAPEQRLGVWQWDYPFLEVVRKGDGTELSGAGGLRTGRAYNPIEAWNSVGIRIAPGVLASDYPTATLDCLPIPQGTPIVITEVWPVDWEPGDDPLYRIDIPNAPKVVCA
jgi:hypothetical protein